jgi:FkbM family methyltransferase
VKEILITDENDYPDKVLGKIYTKLFGYKTDGFLVEIGVGNCIGGNGSLKVNRSNTANLSDMGWTGVYIEPNPTFIDEIKERHKDNNVTVIECAAGDVNAELELRGDTTSVETLHAFQRARWYGAGEDKMAHQVRQRPVNDIFEEANIPSKFELLTVDVEGAEHIILKSLDFNRWRPLVIMLEIRYNDAGFVHSFPNLAQSSRESSNVLLNNGYRVVYEDDLNAFFVCDLLGGAILQ